MPKIMKMHEASLCTAHTEINDNNEDTIEWAKLLNIEGGEDENGRKRPKREQMEAPTIS